MANPTPKWGYQLTFHIYMEGEVDDDMISEKIEAINHAFPDAYYIGAFIQPLRKKPIDQEGL